MSNKFEVKKFNSGEKSVRLNQRLHGKEFFVSWNWFEEKDIMVPLMEADAIRRTYGDCKITLEANYLPYQRQDRIFEAGMGVPSQVVIDVLSKSFDSIITMANHSEIVCSLNSKVRNQLFGLSNLSFEKVIVFPDQSAKNHFDKFYGWENFVVLDKVRKLSGVQLSLAVENINTDMRAKEKINFIICDDICAGGRTFIEAAQYLKSTYPNCTVELMVYHGFMEYGITCLVEAGIDKIYILNPDSYEYIKTQELEQEMEYVKYLDINS